MSLPPLVPVRVPLDATERRRAARHVLLDGFGPDAQARVAGARVLVVGAGGLGSPVLQYLAAAGVGTLGIVDDDVVTPSNLQRQVLHGADDLGERKTASAAATLRSLRPQADVVEHAVRLTADNADGLLAGYDLVVDACDTFATRYLVGDAAARRGLPVVWGTVLGWDGQVSVWWSAAPGGRALTYRDVFGPEPAEGESCETAGVLGPACGVVGTTMAVEVLKLLTGTGDPALGRLLMYDARTSTWDTIPLAAPPAARGATPARETTLDAPESGVAAGRAPRVPAALGLVVDVGREAVVDGAVWVRLEDLAAGNLPPAVLDHPLDAPVVVVCEQGLRSRGAATVLRADGWRDVHPTTYTALASGV
ncbi:UBA/THIF-type NAD/FAD binding protein [Xylanimonas cellulosilytica DSM 15894]|uniref:UBA/THIF-type NAD/FAD binding protein n=1 Tax=Xylanimonas cellulosilytica (strain DSM 15894 / JCM 12276 / CECT 5975 / KCTC 9989 / LMG 20990 / NBRC 107835 / XIL07) TaxID=446471 RepID=D1BSZ4_XYLCX|nr:HesA/MoeB/ThiF family protein [Xylanimonas cellulosilytica]ACZ30836.1 UBA/THIF-type NAD/FAD binding protein [Xylanimonas cellulosilytica DSM 15894]